MFIDLRKNGLQMQRQRGVTLISLLVGMVVSLLTIMAGFTLFKDLIRVAAESKIDAAQDGSLAVAVLRAQMELQNTGYKMERALNDPKKDIKVTNAGATVSWRYKDGTKNICQQLNSTITDQTYKLELLTAESTLCTSDAELDVLDYITGGTSEKLVDLTFYKADGTTFASPQVLMTFDLSTTGEPCTPFAIADLEPTSSSSSGSSSGGVAVRNKHPVLTITKRDAAKVISGTATPPSVQRICLANIAST